MSNDKVWLDSSIYLKCTIAIGERIIAPSVMLPGRPAEFQAVLSIIRIAADSTSSAATASSGSLDSADNNCAGLEAKSRTLPD
ncbi:MAG: hypothetical protein KJN90_05885 [Gammaproteobacteria bacterium]|nr:hypothetical protein [Gammaproteobacteria bacterium]